MRGWGCEVAWPNRGSGRGAGSALGPGGTSGSLASGGAGAGSAGLVWSWRPQAQTSGASGGLSSPALGLPDPVDPRLSHEETALLGSVRPPPGHPWPLPHLPSPHNLRHKTGMETREPHTHQALWVIGVAIPLSGPSVPVGGGKAGQWPCRAHCLGDQTRAQGWGNQSLCSFLAVQLL